MPLLTDTLSVWDIAFRWENKDPSRLWLRIPLEVGDCCRNLIDSILKGELACESISLEKRDYTSDERPFSVYYWLDDIHHCVSGTRYSRKLLKWAFVGRYDLKLWCERMNVPLPEFWFPPGWNIEYFLREGELLPGYGYELTHWSQAERKAYRDSLVEQSLPEASQEVGSSEAATPVEEVAEKMRPVQEARIACQQIAKAIWKDDGTRTIASVVRDELIQKYGGASHYQDATVREWVKVVAPPEVRNKRGRPRKNGDADENLDT